MSLRDEAYEALTDIPAELARMAAEVEAPASLADLLLARAGKGGVILREVA